MKSKRRKNRFSPSMERLETRRLLVGELIELQLDAYRDGASLLDGNREVSLQVGDRFDLKVSYDDLRAFEDEQGAFQLLTDISVSQPEVIVPVLRETQELVFDRSIEMIAFDSVAFSLEGSALTYQATSHDFANNRLASVLDALTTFGYQPADYLVTQIDTGTEFVFQIRYAGEQFGNIDLPDITVEVNETDSATSVPTETREYAPLNPDGSPNIAAVPFNINFSSETFNGGEEFFINGRLGEFDVDSGFIGVGGLGPFVSGGVPAITNDGSFIQPFHAYSLEVEVVAVATDVTFNVLPCQSANAILLYGVDDPVPSDLVLLGSRSQFNVTVDAPPFTTNPSNAVDVNYSGQVSLLDGLSVANALLSSADSEPDGISLDVNEDGGLSPNDLASVLNELVRLETDNTPPAISGQALELEIDALSLSGESLLNADRVLELEVGAEFVVQLSYRDLRASNQRKGALSVFADLSVSDAAAIAPTADGDFASQVVGTPDYSPMKTASFSPSLPDTFDELGALGPVSSEGISDADQSIPVLSFTLVVEGAASGVTFELNLPDAITNELQLYNAALPLEAVNVLLGAKHAFMANFISPSTQAIADQYLTAEDSGSVSIAVLGNDVIPVGQSILSVTTDPTSASGATIQWDEALGVVLYTAPSNFFGTDSFTYTIVDGSGASSFATVTIEVSPVNDSPIALDDFLRTNPGETRTDNIFDAFLSNDNAGPNERDQTISIDQVSETSAEGGTVLIQDDQFTYVPPAGFSGVDTFTYRIIDSEEGTSEIATVIIDVNFLFESVYLELNQDAANDITIRRNGNALIIRDNSDESILLDRPINSISSLTIYGAETLADIIQIDHTTEGLIDYTDEFEPGPSFFGGPFSFFVDGGDSDDDRVIISGTPDSIGAFAQLSADIAGDSAITISDGVLSVSHRLRGFESITFEQMLQIELVSGDLDSPSQGAINVGPYHLNLSASTPINLGSLTIIDGGTLRSTSVLGLDAGETILANGTIEGRVGADAGSLIRATGDLIIGDSSSFSGFETYGDLEVGSHSVTLADANQAVLGGLTTIGSESGEGMLTSENGLIVNFASNVVGHGTIQSTDDLDTPLLNNGQILGESESQPLTLRAFVKGVGKLNQTVVDGTFSPGLSPVISSNGSVAYAAANKIIVELGGALAGSGYDQINHEGTTRLDGLLDVELINGFQPSAGERFEIFRSVEDFVGSFAGIQLPDVDNGLKWILSQDINEVALEVGVDVGQIGGGVQLSIVDGALVFRGADGKNVPLGGQSITLQVTPTDVFDSQDDWRVVSTEVSDGVFVQKVANGEFELRVQGSDWTNFVLHSDVDGSGDTTALDVLQILNQLARGSLVEPGTSLLVDPATLTTFPGRFFDTNGDLTITARDALYVINRLARENSRESELVASLPTSPLCVINDDNVEGTTLLKDTARLERIAIFDQILFDWPDSAEIVEGTDLAIPSSARELRELQLSVLNLDDLDVANDVNLGKNE